MKQITIPEHSKIWFEEKLEVSRNESENTKSSGTFEHDLSLIGNKHNLIAVGEPFYQKLNFDTTVLTNDFKELITLNDFHLVSLSCSFLPDKDCRFTWAQLGIRLEAADKNGAILTEKPIAWNLFPVEVTSSVKYNENLSLSPELKFKIGAIESNAKFFSITSEKEWISYQPQLFSFGYRTSNIAWQFREANGKDIYGDIKDLMMVIMTPKESVVKGEVILSAEISFRGTIWKLFSKKDNIVRKCAFSN